jgi:hypothetical protein
MYEVMVDPNIVATALNRWRQSLYSHAQIITTDITHPRGTERNKRLAWVQEYKFWTHVGGLNDRDYYWCPFGYSVGLPENPINITLEINPIIRHGAARGRILRDSRSHRLLLAHKGAKAAAEGGR